MKKNGLKTIIIVVFCACLCVGYYFYLTQKNSGKEKDLSEVEMIISKDLSLSYPKTAREVVKFYSRIIKCFYDGGYTQEQLEKMTEQSRELMDEELKEKNTKEAYLEAVKEDIESYGKEKKSISSVNLERSSEVIYKTVKGRYCAYVDANYYLMSNKKAQRIKQTFILRKDDDNKWRILGFYGN